MRTRDGRVLEAELRYQRGGTENPMSTLEVVEKYRANARQALSPDAVEELEAAILSVEAQPTLRPLVLLGEAHDRATALADAHATPVARRWAASGGRATTSLAEDDTMPTRRMRPAPLAARARARGDDLRGMRGGEDDQT